MYIAKESPDVSFVLYVLKTCGKNDAVVKTAATKPITSCRSITLLSFMDEMVCNSCKDKN